MADTENYELWLKVLATLNEGQARWYVAQKAIEWGWGGIQKAQALTGMSRPTIIKGMCELRRPERLGSSGRVRQPGGGRKRVEDKDPSIKTALERLLAHETAGDPMTEQRWIRSSTRHLSEKLKEEGHRISAETVRRLLNKQGFSLKRNKRQEFRPECSARDEQFQYIGSQRQAFSAAGLPIVSVDTKKKELIGNFMRGGKAWCKAAAEVHVHDFPSLAACRAVPYGIYDVTKNKGYVFVGTSADTPEFAVESLVRWWESGGCGAYPGALQLLILADGGGCNGYRSRAWKQQLQEKLSDQLGLTVTVCHYPPGCSKWNPIEHRLFSHISLNWAGKPLSTLELMLGYIRGTTTATGLNVQAFRQEGVYKKGQKVTKESIDCLNLYPHAVCPDWNYTISPRCRKAHGEWLSGG
jgi:transposase